MARMTAGGDIGSTDSSTADSSSDDETADASERNARRAIRREPEDSIAERESSSESDPMTDMGSTTSASASGASLTEGQRQQLRESMDESDTAADQSSSPTPTEFDQTRDPFAGAQAGSDVIRNGRPGPESQWRRAEQRFEERVDDARNAARGAREAVAFDTGEDPLRREAEARAETAINAQRGAAEAVAAETGANPFVEAQEDEAAARVAERTGLDAGEDFTVDTRGEQIVVRLTEEGRQSQLDQDNLSQFVGDVESATGLDVPGDGPLVEERATGEQFGDIDWSGGLGDPEKDEVESALDDVSGGIMDASRGAGEFLFDPETGAMRESAGEELLRAAGRPDLGRAYERNLRELGMGITTGAGALGAQAPQLLTEAPEFVGFAATNPGATAERLPRAATTQAVVMGESAVSNPAGFTGELAGSAALSGGVFRATQGTRLGTAARYSLQPGEELVKSGIRRGVVGARAARATPGVSMGQVGVETAGPAVNVRDRVSSSIGGVRDRAPSVRVEADPNAGILEVDPQLQRQIRDATVGRAARGVETIRDTPANLRSAVGGGIETGRRAVDDVSTEARRAFETGRQQFTRAELRAEEGGYRAGLRAQEEATRLLNTDPTELGRRGVSSIADGARETFSGGIETGKQRFTQAELQAEEIGFRAGERVGESITSLGDMSAPDISGRVRAEATAARFGAAERATDIGYRAGYRVGESINTLEAAPESIRSAPGAGLDILEGGIETGKQRFTQAELQAEEIGFRAGERVGETISSVEDLSAPDITGRASTELTAARFGAAERAADIQRGLSNVRDITIRVGNPDRATIFETDVDEPAIRSQLDDPLGLGFGSEIETARETETDAFESDIDRDFGTDLDTRLTGESGVALQRVVTRGDSKSKTDSSLEGEVADDLGLLDRSVEATFAPEQTFRTGTFGEVDASVDTGLITVGDIELAQEPSIDSATTADTSFETGIEDVNLGDVAIESDTTLESDVGLDLEQELELEPAIEPSVEPGRELFGGDRRPRDDEEGGLLSFGGRGGRFEQNLANPLGSVEGDTTEPGEFHPFASVPNMSDGNSGGIGTWL